MYIPTNTAAFKLVKNGSIGKTIKGITESVKGGT